MNASSASFTAVVLAADRGPGDEVARAAGTPCKSLVPVGGVPMVMRVLEALDGAQNVCDKILCGPPQPALKTHRALDRLISSGNLQWMPNQATPSTSTLSVLETLARDKLVLVTTADHALLNTQIVDYFCSQALASGCDIAVGLARYDQVVTAYPGMRRTAIRLSDAHYCSCNLFAFLTPAARKIADLWRQVENQRKKPWRIIGLLGWMAVLRYATGNLSLIQAQRLISRRLGVQAAAVVLPFADAAVDVDTVDDWRFVEGLIKRKEPGDRKTFFDSEPG
jgi:GTP:adenosylcobinamide-phosphate guanylyltransferase